MLVAYFDESETRKKHPVICMAGIVFEVSKAQAVDAKQKEIYDTFQIPDYHAAPCKAGEAPYSHLDQELRDNLRRQMAEYVIDHAEFSVGEAVGVEEYKRTIGRVRPDFSDYEFCLVSCMGGIVRWANSVNYAGQIAYIFESGAKHQEHADRLLRHIISHPGERLFHKYASHTFASKKYHRPLHLADLAAWEFSNSIDGLRDNRDSAPGYVRIIREMPASYVFHDEEELEKLVPVMAQAGRGIPPNSMTLLPSGSLGRRM